MSIDNSLKDSFLTAEIKREHIFVVPNDLSSQIVCEDTMHESKLSIVLPFELLQTFRQFVIDLRDVFNEKFNKMRNNALLKIYSGLMKELDSNIEAYTEMIDYLRRYKGPSFKPSKNKFRFDSAAIPINLHVQRLKVGAETLWSCITCGTVTAAALRFRHGGLSRIRHNLTININETSRNHMDVTLFYNRQKTLENAKIAIENLSHRINTEFETNQETRLCLFSEVKQLYQLLLDLIQHFPNIDDLIDALCSNGLAQMKRPLVGKSLSNQLESLDETFTDLDTKMAAGNDQTSLQNTKTLLDSVLNMLRGLIKSVYYAQFMGLILASRNPTDVQRYFQLQLRYDIVLTQAVTIVSTCLLNNIDQSTREKLEESWTKYGPVISFYGLLTCHHDEQGMIEDMREIWSVFYDHVRFKFIPLNSTNSTNCIPQINGHSTDIKVTIPLPVKTFEKLPENYANGDWFRVNAVYWNVAVNQDTKNRSGDLVFEEDINRTALSTISRIVSFSKTPDQKMFDLIDDLEKALDEYPSRKVVVILRRVQAITHALNGSSIISCKSGKDRTSMALTFECGVFLKKVLGASHQQMEEIVATLRRDGTRRENCRKNIGIPMFYCSPKQLSFMPKEFHPPTDTYSHNISS